MPRMRAAPVWRPRLTGRHTHGEYALFAADAVVIGVGADDSDVSGHVSGSAAAGAVDVRGDRHAAGVVRAAALVEDVRWLSTSSTAGPWAAAVSTQSTPRAAIVTYVKRTHVQASDLRLIIRSRRYRAQRIAGSRSTWGDRTEYASMVQLMGPLSSPDSAELLRELISALRVEGRSRLGLVQSSSVALIAAPAHATIAAIAHGPAPTPERNRNCVAGTCCRFASPAPTMARMNTTANAAPNSVSNSTMPSLSGSTRRAVTSESPHWPQNRCPSAFS